MPAEVAEKVGQAAGGAGFGSLYWGYLGWGTPTPPVDAWDSILSYGKKGAIVTAGVAGVAAGGLYVAGYGGVTVTQAAAAAKSGLVAGGGVVVTKGKELIKGGWEMIRNRWARDVFPKDPSKFRPDGLIKQEYNNGKIIKWLDPKTKKAKFEWNSDKNGGHYHVTPDGKHRTCI